MKKLSDTYKEPNMPNQKHNDQHDGPIQALSQSNLLAKLAPNAGIIGIDQDLRVFEGYDGSIECAALKLPDYIWDEDDIDHWKGEQLTNDEKLCLAEIMLERWKTYRDSIANAKDRHD